MVTEADLMGTLTGGYEVPGLRDSIRSGGTGLLWTCDRRALAGAAVALLKDRALAPDRGRRRLEIVLELFWKRPVVSFEKFMMQGAVWCT